MTVQSTISKQFGFSSSHQLDGLPEDHPCSRLHGHNYVVTLELQGETDETGFVFDYRKLDAFKSYLDDELDHRHLNDVLPFNPTAEHMADHFAQRARDMLEMDSNVWRVQVSVSETPKTLATSQQYVARHVERNL